MGRTPALGHGVRHLRRQPSRGCGEDFLLQHSGKLEDPNPQPGGS